MFVAGRAATEFMDVPLVAVVDRVILPVSVPAHQDYIVSLLVLQQVEEYLSFVQKALPVGMIVSLRRPVGANDRVEQLTGTRPGSVRKL